LKTWPLRHVWLGSALVGGLCVLVMMGVKIGLFIWVPEATPAFRAGEATAPENRAFLTLIRELAISVVVVPLIETSVLFYLPSLALHRLRGAVGAAAFVTATGGMGWVLHGADLHAVAHGLCFALLGAWFSAVLIAHGRGRALLATSAAHGVWNATFLLIWFVRAWT